MQKNKSNIINKLPRFLTYSLFIFLLFTSIKITTMSSDELAGGTISILGITITLNNDINAMEEEWHPSQEEIDRMCFSYYFGCYHQTTSNGYCGSVCFTNGDNYGCYYL